MPFILQHDLLIYKQARKLICNTHKLQPGVGYHWFGVPVSSLLLPL